MTIPFFLLAVLAAGLVAAANSLGYLNADSAWVLSAAQRWLAGERLYLDIIETNPPLIIYLSAIPVLAAQALGLSVSVAFVLLVTLLSLFSLALACVIVRDGWLRSWAAAALILLPGTSFGQREHLFLILLLPYFLTFLAPFRSRPAIMIPLALMAATGMALKPYFLLFWFALLLTELLVNRRIRHLFRGENFLIAFVLAGYVACVYWHEQDYFTRVVPLLLNYYSAFSLVSAKVLNEASGMLRWFLLPTGAYLLIAARERRDVPPAFLYALTALLAAFAQIMAQMKGWSNHSYPLYAFGILLCFEVMRECFSRRRELQYAGVFLFSLAITLAMLAYSILGTCNIAAHARDEKVTSLIALLDREAAGQPVAFFGLNMPDVYPALFYSKAYSVLRYGHFWMIPGMYAQTPMKDGEAVFHPPAERKPDEAALLAAIAEDLSRRPPRLIVFTHARFKKGEEFCRFDFQRYFAQTPSVAELFSHYRRIATLGEQDIYRREPLP